MKKLLLPLLAISIAVLGLYGCGKKTAVTNVPAAQEVKEPVLTGLDGINYSFKTLQDSTVNYLKTKSEYKDLYTDKKFAVYYVGADCPYAQAFIDTIEPLKNVPEMAEKYNFYAQEAAGMKTFASMDEANADVDFSNTCHEFCIVKPDTNQVFSIDGIGYDEASKLDKIFEQLKDW